MRFGGYSWGEKADALRILRTFAAQNKQSKQQIKDYQMQKKELCYNAIVAVLGRSTPFETRGHVALAGTFGYELDITKIPEEDRQQIPAQTAMYHKYNDLIRRGDYWRIASYLENGSYDCYMVASKDKKEALITYVQVLSRPNFHSRRVRLKGLSPENRYRIEETGEVLGGDVLMQAGMLIAPLWGDYRSRLIHLTEA